ncbi:MAG: hypothetical protein ABJN95_16665 [Maribacter sp.]|uniref:hypothetical protein n=1 Tax=Maribacter sp. TaxID=1897614 RepID=UPI003297E5BE
MTLNERLVFCTICQNRKIDFEKGLLCALTNEKPDFEDSCELFLKDEKEADRKLNLKLDAAGNAQSQKGSLHPKKNINYGIFLMISGVFVLLFLSLLFGAIITFSGISFLIRGMQQKKILQQNNAFNERLDSDENLNQQK